MKIFILILLAIFTTPVFAQQTGTSTLNDVVYTAEDVAIFDEIITKFTPQKNAPIATLIPDIGKYFLGNEYVSFALEETDHEQLIVNLRDLDCTTYAENLLALARTIKAETPTFQAFAKELERIRYRDGLRGDYPTRLHYFSEWIYNNKVKNIVQTPADSFGENYPNQLDFMSTHPQSYKHLQNNPEFVEEIAKREAWLSAQEYFFIPKEKIAENLHLLKHGDIVGFTTSISGLDMAHVGILIEQNSRLHVLHASQTSRKVEISDETITSFLKPNSRNTGIMIARPAEI